MVKNQYQHPMSTFMPIPRTNTSNTNSTFKFLPTKQQQQLNSLSSSTKSNKSAISGISSFTNSSSYRSSDGNVVVIEVGVDDVGIDVGQPDHGQLCLGSTSPSSLSASSDDSPSSANSLSSKNNKEFEMYSTETFESSNSSEERGIDCPDYFVPEVKQKPCYPPSIPVLQLQPEIATRKSETKKFKSKKSSSTPYSNSENIAVKQTPGATASLVSATSRSNLLETCEVAAEVATVTNVDRHKSFGASSIRYIDDQSNTPVQKPQLPLSKAESQLDFSFETTLKNNYSEFSFVSPSKPNNSNNKPKVQPKPSLSLDTFENVINDLNEPISQPLAEGTKISAGKRLFLEKKKSSDDSQDLDSKPSQAFNKRNSMKRGSSKRFANHVSYKNQKKSTSYDDKPIVLFSGAATGLVNIAYEVDIDERPKKCDRPPTPPPRADKPSPISLFDESNNYNLERAQVADKTCYIEEIVSSSKVSVSEELSLSIKTTTLADSSQSEIEDIFKQISHIQTKLESTKVSPSQELNLINSLYEAQNGKNTLELYNKIISLSKSRGMKPECLNSFELVQEIMTLLDNSPACNERAIDTMSLSFTETTDELCLLLNKLDVKSLLLTHDQLAECNQIETIERQKQNRLLMSEHEETEPVTDSTPNNTNDLTNEISFDKSTELTEEGQYLMQKAEHYGAENLKLVNIEKTETPLGATIRNRDGSVVIGRVVSGGTAEKSGLLHEEDEILEINNVPVRGKTINDICDMLFNIQGIVSFLIIPNMDYESCVKAEISHNEESVLHIRALYNYIPLEDIYIPCKELGLTFHKGDILHVISQEDDDWWQAYNDQDKGQDLAGLIPSQKFQEKRCSQMQAFIGDSFIDRKKRIKGGCMKGISKSKRRQIFENLNETFKGDIVTYEQVTLYKPPADRKRPIVLIGPHSIGRHELRKMLMQTFPSIFEVAVPHTTRTARRDETDGKDYHFLPRHIFEADIKQGRFIEHGEYEKNLYGTSYEAIKKVIDNGRICVLNLYPQALKTLRNTDLMPYVIYIGPSNLAKLKELKSRLNENYRENDLLDIIDKGREIEETYGHYFDKIIRNSEMDKTYEDLYATIQQVQNEESWVPSRWLKPPAIKK